MLKTIVFVETSLAHAEAINFLPNAFYMPSIKKGDVIKAIKMGYKRIVIIDGHFGWTPSIWHKEIMMALDYKIEVFGAASMGAIRAAELDMYGMKGIGTVYSMYKNEDIDGDDEVAIVVSPYTGQKTIPLINIRITLQNLKFKSKKNIFSKIKNIFYAERTWGKIEQNIPKNAYDLIRTHYIDIKKEDAIALLNLIGKLPFSNKKAEQPTTYPTNKELNNNVDLPRLIEKTHLFTVFEKNLIESIFNLVIFNQIKVKPGGNFKQLIRAKNLIKLLSLPKDRDLILHYQSLVNLIDDQEYKITETEVRNQINLFREENNLFSGHVFKAWLIRKKLFNSDLGIIFPDYIKIKKYLLISYDYNSYFTL